jgi:Predicted membrane protein (DUF2306)
MIRGKQLVFAGILGMTAYVLYHNEGFLIEPNNPIWGHYSKYGWWLLTHGVAGACALVLAPMQFSERLRKRYTRLHRVSGRTYVVGALVLAPLGAYVQYMARGSMARRARSPSWRSSTPQCFGGPRSSHSRSRCAGASRCTACG